MRERHRAALQQRLLDDRVDGLRQVADLDRGQRRRHVVHRVLVHAATRDLARREIARELHGAADEVAFDFFADQAISQRLLAADRLARTDHLRGALDADEARQTLRATCAGDDAEVRFGLAGEDAEALLRDARFARHRELDAAAKREAVERGDGRLLHCADDVDATLAAARGRFAFRNGLDLGEEVHVSAADEGLLAKAREHNALHALVLVAFDEARGDLFEHALIERVEDLGPTDRQHRDAVGVMAQHVVDAERLVLGAVRLDALRHREVRVLCGIGAHEFERLLGADLVHHRKRGLHHEGDLDAHVEVADRHEARVDDFAAEAEVGAHQVVANARLLRVADFDLLIAARDFPVGLLRDLVLQRLRRAEPAVDLGRVLVEADCGDRVAAGEVHRRERPDAHLERLLADDVDLLRRARAFFCEQRAREEQAFEDRVERVAVARLHRDRHLADRLVERHQPCGRRRRGVLAAHDLDHEVALGGEEVVHDAAAALVGDAREDHLGLQVARVADEDRVLRHEAFDLREDLRLQFLVLGRGLDDEVCALEVVIVGRECHAREHLVRLLLRERGALDALADLLLELRLALLQSGWRNVDDDGLHAERRQDLGEEQRDVRADLAGADDGDLLDRLAEVGEGHGVSVRLWNQAGCAGFRPRIEAKKVARGARGRKRGEGRRRAMSCCGSVRL